MANPTPADALRIAKIAVAARYDGAAYAFAAGSIMRGEGTRLSDIDLVVVYDRLDAARREAFMAENIPVEAFIHDPETLAWFIDEDVRTGCPVLLDMIVHGVVIGDAEGSAKTLQEDMARQLDEGPPALTRDALDALRYQITDTINDLRGERSDREIMAIGAVLYPSLVELTLRGRGNWNGTGKWAARLLAAADSDLAAQFHQAFGKLFTSGASDGVIELAEQVLERHGGPLFTGYRRVAPATWRTARDEDR
ncbi:MAG TPA: nucleotidyltransferase domain-containing protein [Caulobacteraceae bacterium]|jgi:predicted nucleotidyltransferase